MVDHAADRQVGNALPPEEHICGAAVDIDEHGISDACVRHGEKE